MAPRKITDGYLILLRLSDNGMIERMADQIKLPHPIAGKSDLLSREEMVYLGSYKYIYILSSTDEGKLKLLSFIPIEGYHISLALHPQEPILYAISNEGIFTLDVSVPENPRLVEHLSLEELLKGVGEDSIRNPVGMDVACMDEKLFVAVREKEIGRSGVILVLDLRDPLHPEVDRILEKLPGAAAIAAGKVDHQIFAAGDEIVEYRNFEREGHFKDNRWMYQLKGRIPGEAVEMKFVPMAVFGGVVVSLDKLQKMIRRTEDLSARQQLRTLADSHHGIVYIATEHALAYLGTWGVMVYKISDYFDHIYGMDTKGSRKGYLAAGEEGIYIVNLPLGSEKVYRFITLGRYKDIPSPVLDVCVSGDKLLALCGELRVENVIHNESIR
jgi:hypothetical protein